VDKTKADKVMELVKRKGVLRPRDLEAYDIPRTYLARLCKRGELSRVGRGLYVYVHADLTAHHTLAEVCKRVPDGVVCLLTALEFHHLTTQMPYQVWLAISREMRKPTEPLLPMRIMRFSGESFTAGVEAHQIEGVTVQIYNPAKTVVDCFKFRNKVGLDVAIEALRDCRRERKCTNDQIWEYAKICRQTNVMMPYMEALA
jgi:predicted transcriptional regulator of viral defense system